MSEQQFEFLMESMKFEIEKKEKIRKEQSENRLISEEVNASLRRLDAMEGKETIPRV